MTPERLQYIREQLCGPDAEEAHEIDLGVELLEEVERLQSFASEVAEVLSEYMNGTTDEDVCNLRDLAFSVAPDWQAREVPTRAELVERAEAAERLAVQIFDALDWYDACCFPPDVMGDHDCPELPDDAEDIIDAWRRASGMQEPPWRVEEAEE